ncbi:MAG: hypothetical protein AAGA28_16160 [Pseudomonadota bacterium]
MALTHAVPDDRTQARRQTSFLIVFGIAVLAALLCASPNLADPMMRFDDFPAYFPEPKYFWLKTLNEGRWVNYLWHLRGVETPSWLNFVFYQTCWALFGASIAYVAFRDDRRTWFAAILAALIVISPPATLISLWYNTLIPGLALVAFYAFLGTVLSQKQHRFLLPVFVVLGFMSYTTYPLLLLAVCLVRTEQRSLLDLIGLLALFTLSFAGAVLIAYALNFHVHGVFGIPLADWRHATPAQGFAGLIGNLSVVRESFATFALHSSANSAFRAMFYISMLGLAAVALARQAPLEALYLVAGLLTGAALVTVQCLKTGAMVPPRAFIFAWLFFAVILVRAAYHLYDQSDRRKRLASFCVILVFALGTSQTVAQYHSYRNWQMETRKLGEVLANETGPIHVFGKVLDLEAAQVSFIQDPLALKFRVRQVSGAELVLCDENPRHCASPGVSRIEIVGDPGRAQFELSLNGGA